MSGYLTLYADVLTVFFSPGLTVIQAFQRKVKLGNVRKRKKQVEVNFSWVCLGGKGIIHGGLSDPYQASNSLIRTQSFLGTSTFKLCLKEA